MEQLELVSRARGGDHDAFAVLVDEALARLDAAARLIVRDTELARDAVQDAMLKAWRQLPTLREPERFDAWLIASPCVPASTPRGVSGGTSSRSP